MYELFILLAIVFYNSPLKQIPTSFIFHHSLFIVFCFCLFLLRRIDALYECHEHLGNVSCHIIKALEFLLRDAA